MNWTIETHLVFTLGSRVQVRDLVLLKCYDKSGKTMQTLSVVKRACHKWQEIADLLSNDPNTAERLRQKFNSDPYHCLKQLLADYFVNCKSKPANSDYTQDWNGIIELLNDVDEETLAAKVRDMLTI